MISSEKWFNYVVALICLFVFFSKIPKTWVDWTTLNGENKEDGLNN